MDNTAKYGFRIHKSLYGDAMSHPEVMPVATGYQASPGGTSVDLNIGDPIKRLSDGTAALCAAGDTLLYGICVGVRPYWDGSKMVPYNKLPGGTAWGTVEERRSDILVVGVDQCLWEVDADDKTTATTLAGYRAFFGENADHAFSADSTSKKANGRLDISTHGTATSQWRIIDVSGTVENQDFSGLYVKLIVAPNEVATQRIWGGTTGV